MLSLGGNDYANFGDHVGMEAHVIQLISEEPLKRGSAVMDHWVQKNGKAATLHALHIILSDLQMISLKEHVEHFIEN